jgi:uroporphyrinogen-III synthase
MVRYSLDMSYGGAAVLSFESRRAAEIAELIRNNDGVPFVAPALREVPLEQNEQVFRFADRLYADEFDMVIFLTGVGTRLIGKVLETREPADMFQAALRHVTVVARGPKPSAVLREWKVPVSVTVPEPNTWRELLAAVSNRPEKSVAVQEYGRPNGALVEGLQAQRRRVETVPVYQWELPVDTAALSDALDGLLANRFAVSMFTTGVQVDHFLEFAARTGQAQAAVDALRRTFVASVGPDCSETLRAHGVEPDFEPVHPKMGFLVREAGQRFAERVTR